MATRGLLSGKCIAPFKCDLMTNVVVFCRDSRISAFLLYSKEKEHQHLAALLTTWISQFLGEQLLSMPDDWKGFVNLFKPLLVSGRSVPTLREEYISQQGKYLVFLTKRIFFTRAPNSFAIQITFVRKRKEGSWESKGISNPLGSKEAPFVSCQALGHL